MTIDIQLKVDVLNALILENEAFLGLLRGWSANECIEVSNKIKNRLDDLNKLKHEILVELNYPKN
jgi:hypothetical protein